MGVVVTLKRRKAGVKKPALLFNSHPDCPMAASTPAGLNANVKSPVYIPVVPSVLDSVTRPPRPICEPATAGLDESVRYKPTQQEPLLHNIHRHVHLLVPHVEHLGQY